MNFITGEQIQEKCDVYLGHPGDFRFNPRISRQSKCFDIDLLVRPWANPRLIFIYSHRLPDFMAKLHLIQNSFVLVSHNSDENITEKYQEILDHPKLIIWHAQNPMVKHVKLHLLPIGIANSMWRHGNLASLRRILEKNNPKVRDIYFYFNLITNKDERLECKEALEMKLAFEQPKGNFEEYLDHLSKHKYAICPPGNGIDSHRIWECLYLGVIPIVKRSTFTELLSESYPCVILNSWQEFDQNSLSSNIPMDRFIIIEPTIC